MRWCRVQEVESPAPVPQDALNVSPQGSARHIHQHDLAASMGKESEH
jgi:hypothetical protein